jgi:DNA-binding XRE family transcriptional regulator
VKIQTIEINDKTMVVLSKDDFDALMEKAGVLPALPARTTNGGYPAREAMAAVTAREIVSRRIRAGWTQRDLAARAGLRAEQISRIESGKHSPTNETLTRLETAFKSASQQRRRGAA